MSNLYNSFLQTSILLGSAIGSFLGGSLASLGWKWGILISNYIYILAKILCVIDNVWAIMVGRLICGLMVGSLNTLCPKFMNEICPQGMDKLFGVFPTISLSSGIFLSYIVGQVTVPYIDETEYSDCWRIIFAFPLVFSFFMIFCLYFIFPIESP